MISAKHWQTVYNISFLLLINITSWQFLVVFEKRHLVPLCEIFAHENCWLKAKFVGKLWGNVHNLEPCYRAWSQNCFAHNQTTFGHCRKIKTRRWGVTQGSILIPCNVAWSQSSLLNFSTISRKF
jgi:hypothetical protein